MSRRRPRTLLLAAAYAVVLALLVFSPIADLLNRLTVRMYVVWKYDLRLPGNVLPEDFGFALNVLLFVPVGVLVAAFLRRPWWVAPLVCVVLSLGIELVQLVPALDRDFDIGDVVANGSGGLSGAIAFALAARFRDHRASGSSVR